MSRLRLFKLLFPLSLLLIFLAGKPTYAEPGDDLAVIWKRIGEIGSYRFTADVEQTLFPLPVPENLGPHVDPGSLR
jgi:hypothetical protein